MPEAKPRVQSWAGFKSDLLAAAKGQPAPASAAGLVVESGEALMRLLTPENRELLRMIRAFAPGMRERRRGVIVKVPGRSRGCMTMVPILGGAGFDTSNPRSVALHGTLLCVLDNEALDLPPV